MEARRRIFIVLAVLAAALVAGAVVAGAQGSMRLPVLIVGGAVAVAAAILVGIVIATKAARSSRGKASERRSTGDETADRLGLAYEEKPAKGFHQQFGPLPGIPNGGDVRHALRGRFEDRSLCIFQHTYVVNTGQAVVPVNHTAYVFSAPAWPAVTVTRRRGLGPLLFRLGRRRGLLLDDEAFNAAMKVKTDDEDFAITLLHPEMQAFIARKPTVTWHVHAGHVAMIYNGALKLDRIGASLDRARQFWTLVPEELANW
jgi:hypothetical protein